MKEAELSKSGVRLAADFRDNLIVDRYDPIFATMRASKLKHLRSQNSEDVLTWNAFRSLRQIAPAVWLPGLLTAALGDVALPVEKATVRLWQSVKPPLSLLAHGDEGASEVDVVIEAPSWVWFVEAKFRSDISSGTTTRPDRDQVLRNIDVGTHYAGVRSFYFALLTVNRDHSRGLEALVQCQDLDGTRRRLSHREDALRNLKGLGHFTWTDVCGALVVASRTAELEFERQIASRALEWMRSRGIEPSA